MRHDSFKERVIGFKFLQIYKLHREKKNIKPGYQTILKDMITFKLTPIISWIHAVVEQRADKIDGDNFVTWWKTVAVALKDQPYAVAFNLFTEIGDGALKRNPDRYNDWTRLAIQAIRSSGGNNEKRIIILGAPAKDSDSLSSIASDIYTGQSYIMSEWHLYASGLNKNDGQKSWFGTGRQVDRDNVNSVFKLAADWSKATQVWTWAGAPHRNVCIGAAAPLSVVPVFLHSQAAQMPCG
jgi:hypothetical protein